MQRSVCAWRILILLGASLYIPFFFFPNAPVAEHQFLWDPYNLEACEETSCFLYPNVRIRSKVRQLRSIQGRTALESLKEYLRRRPVFATPDFLLKSDVRPSLAKCSFIGGAPSPRDDSHGEIIDSAPTIRLNRRYPSFLRAEGFPTHLGSRTDILVLQRHALRTIERYSIEREGSNHTFGHSRFLAGASFFKEKPVVLYRARCLSNPSACIDSLEALQNSTIPGHIPFWLIHHDIERLARDTLKRFGRPKLPSIGIAGMVVALRVCKRINVFAMNGSIDGDGDFYYKVVSKGHNLDIERRFVRWLATCPQLEDPWCGRVKLFS